MCTLLLFFDSNLATAQSNQLIISTKGTKIAMNPHLHGVDRNHYVGYFGDGWKENMYDKKIEMYDAIQNNFAEKKGPIYRIGHNVTDGNAGFEAGDYNLSHPGWHWATKYGNGFNEEYFSTIYTTNTTPVLSSFGLLNTAKTTTTRLGAGVRRYCYVAQLTGGQTIFSGFVVVNNYKNSITLDYDKLPKSNDYSNNNGDFTVPDLIGKVRNAVTSSSVFEVIQIDGPAVNCKVLTPGCYELDYRITNKEGDVAYWAIIFSVNNPSNSGKIVRLQDDVLNVLDPNSFSTGTSALVKHSLIQTINNSRVIESTASNYNQFMDNVVETQQNAAAFDLPDLAMLHQPYGYDDLELMLEEPKKLHASGLALGINISTGYPEEAEGLLEYMYELGEKVAFVELGCELMGLWNKGSYKIANTPTNAGKTTMPFARKIKHSTNPKIRQTKVATTSTYGYTCEFIEGYYCDNMNLNYTSHSQNGQIKEIMQDWLIQFREGNEFYIDYINLHDYPDRPTIMTPLGDEKIKKIAGNHLDFQKRVIPAIREVLSNLDLPNPVGIVVTEANSGTNREAVPENTVQQNSFTEALYFTESFMVAAKEKFAAHIPFALLKTSYLSDAGSFGYTNADPSHPSSFIIYPQDPDNSIHFYPNTVGKNPRISVVTKTLAPPNVQGISSGILLYKKRGINVHNNRVFLQNDDPLLAEPRFYGLYKSEGSNNSFCSNEITGLQGFDRGMGTYMSPGNISCNKVDFTKQALYMEADNRQNDAITSNLFTSSLYGIYVNNSGSIMSALGTQTRQENQWPGIWNQGGYWNGDLFGIQFSKFFNYPQYPWQPNDVYPVGNDWFDNQLLPTIPVPICPIPGIDPLNCQEFQVEQNSGKLGTLAQNQKKLVEPYRSMILRQEYDKIKEEYVDQSVLPTVLQDFVSSIEGTSIATLSTIDNKLARPLAGEPNLEQQEIDLNKAIQDVLPELQLHYDWLYSLSTEDYQTYVASGQESYIVTQLEQLNAQLGELRTQIEQVIEQVYDEVKDLNKPDYADNKYVALEKEMNAYVITSLKFDRDSFTESDWKFIHEVANRCPQDWGDGVLKARGLWLKYGGAFELKWQECFPVHDNKKVSEGRNLIKDTQGKWTNNLSIEGVVVYPVPVTDELNLKLPDEYIGCKFEIVNITGVICRKGIIKASNEQFDATNLNDGMYFIQIRADNMHPIVVKFLVQKF
jgi:hypothetical protein